MKKTPLIIAALLLFGGIAWANVTSVGISNGVPNTGTGTVSTLDNFPSLATSAAWPTLSVKTGLTATTLQVSGSAITALGPSQCDNNNSTWIYLQIFNAPSASVTLGSTAPTFVLMLAPQAPGGIGTSLNGISLGGTGFTIAATTTPTGSSGPATSTINCSFAYK